MTLTPGMLRIGILRLPVSACFHSLGLVLALFLSERTARRTAVSPAAAWTAGVVAITFCFMVSRLTLIFFNGSSFLAYPWALLRLPSFTGLDLLISAAAFSLYLAVKGLPVRSIADAWTPPLLLLAMVVDVGQFVEGTGAGMPSSLPWAMRGFGDSVLGPVQPVQLYSAIVALALCVWTWVLLGKGGRPGMVAGAGLVLGGAASFLLDMLRQPEESMGSSWLDAPQAAALIGMVAGVVLWSLGAGTWKAADLTEGRSK